MQYKFLWEWFFLVWCVVVCLCFSVGWYDSFVCVSFLGPLSDTFFVKSYPAIQYFPEGVQAVFHLRLVLIRLVKDPRENLATAPVCSGIHPYIALALFHICPQPFISILLNPLAHLSSLEHWWVFKQWEHWQRSFFNCILTCRGPELGA